MRVLIVSIGNPFMKDDGAGQSILSELRNRAVHADLMDLGTDIFRLSLHGEGYTDIIILDSLRGVGEPGDIMSFSGDDLGRSLDSKLRSAHLMGSIEGIEILRSSKPSLMNVKFHLVGILAGDISLGEGLTHEVRMSVSSAADRVCDIISKKTLSEG